MTTNEPTTQEIREVTRRGLKLFRNSRAGESHLRAEEAVIEVNKLGWQYTLLRLYAIQEQDRWWIARSKKRRGS